MAKIGFIGLGIMGAHMARNLLKGGHTLFVNGAYPVPEDLGKSTNVVANSTAVAQAADIVIIMVPDTPDVANVLFADGSVKFLKDSTSVDMIWGLGSRAGGEILSSDSY